MKWTKTKPTEPGWYWLKEHHGLDKDTARVVQVREYSGELCILNWPIPSKAIWAGPIAEPEKSDGH